MKSKYRQSIHKEFEGDRRGDLFFNDEKYFEFHSYPSMTLHKFWAIVIMLLLLFKMGDLFAAGIFYGLSAVYLLYVTWLTHYLLIKKICRYKGYFLYPQSFVDFFKKRRKSADSRGLN